MEGLFAFPINCKNIKFCSEPNYCMFTILYSFILQFYFNKIKSYFFAIRYDIKFSILLQRRISAIAHKSSKLTEFPFWQSFFLCFLCCKDMGNIWKLLQQKQDYVTEKRKIEMHMIHSWFCMHWMRLLSSNIVYIQHKTYQI